MKAPLAAAVLAAAVLAIPVPAGSAGGSADTLARVGRQYAFVFSPEVTDLVRDVADTVSRAYRAPSGRYRVWVVDDPGVNAFITPSGDIFLFSGQLLSLHGEDELAGVLAHEMAHAEADHFGRLARRSALVTIPTIAAMILSRGEQGVVAGAIAVAEAYQLHFSREMEEEADLRAISALRRTPYDPLGMAGALRTIEDSIRLVPVDVPDHLSTHPPVDTRRASLEAVLRTPLDLVAWTPRASRRWLRVRAVVAGLRARSGEPLVLPDPEAPSPDHRRGVALLAAGRPREALPNLEAALEKQSGDPLVQADLGAARYALGDRELARPLLEAAWRGRPDLSTPPFLLAELAREAGDGRRAEALYQAAMDGRPELPEAFHRAGELAAEEGRGGESAYYLGTAALLAGRFREARALLREADDRLGGNAFWKERVGKRLDELR